MRCESESRKVGKSERREVGKSESPEVGKSGRHKSEYMGVNE